MPFLPDVLHVRLQEVLIQCDEFKSDAALQAVFVTTELGPFQGGLPQASSKSQRVSFTVEYLLDKHLEDGRPVLPIFLKALRNRRSTADGQYSDLSKLGEEVEAALGPKPASASGIAGTLPPNGAASLSSDSVVAPPVVSVTPTANLRGGLSSEQGPSPGPGQKTPSSDSKDRTTLAFALVGAVLTFAIGFLNLEQVRCLVDHRLTEAIVALIVFLAVGAGLVFSSLTAGKVRTRLQMLYGGIAIGLLVLVFIVLAIPPISVEICNFGPDRIKPQ